jgi:uncharacterized membrane protein YuzA (DUF378 family)
MSGWSITYIKKLLFKIAMIFLIVGGLNYIYIGISDKSLFDLFGPFSIFIYIIIGISAIIIMFNRDTYLPFLGPTVMPCPVLENREPPGATKEVKVVIEPNVKVIYWAAEPASEKLKMINSWKEAYLEYQNAGVATSNGEGVVILKVREPQAYTVPLKGKLEPHVHYRVCGEAGWLGRINTIMLHPIELEGFYPYRVTDLADTAASIF